MGHFYRPTRRISGGFAVRCIRWFAGVTYEKGDAKRRIANMSGGWISVTERLPEKGVPVIGWFPGATQSFECALNEHDGVWCEWGTRIYLYEDERPTHWMPFPAGPTDAK
jgi:hypothetical protein